MATALSATGPLKAPTSERYSDTMTAGVIRSKFCSPAPKGYLSRLGYGCNSISFKFHKKTSFQARLT